MEKFYITTAIPYVNASPHVGHSLEFVEADVIARHEKALKKDVYFLSGTDENAIKNFQAAEKAGIGVQEFVDKNSSAFEQVLKALNISNNQFIKTTEERHKKGAQALWLSTDKDDLYKKTYRGLYCVGCEQFYEPGDLNEKGECFEHPGKPLETVEEENYFFRLSKYQSWLRDLISSGKLKIVPEIRKNEVLSVIDKGLQDFSVSRPVERSHGWGVPVPGDEKQTIYVWYDALSNYITALGYPDEKSDLYKKYWLQSDVRLHVIGKGISRFHAIYWPAMLQSAGLPLPTEEFIHGYVTAEGQKISKTIGNVIDPLEVIKKYGTDPLRYYLLREIPAYLDGDFSFKRFEERYNSDLANGLGNFSARVLSLANSLGSVKKDEVSKDVEEKINEIRQKVNENLKEFKFHEALASIWELLSFGDAKVNSEKPWAVEDQSKKSEIVFNLLTILDNVASLVDPFMPETSRKITECIIWEGDSIKAKRGEVLFLRLPKS
ncbi:methionine--tRNA ligase [Patescibacteria group bacterium]|nr:methionine--tRNA ligase [Patescibacteria group bacterium]